MMTTTTEPPPEANLHSYSFLISTGWLSGRRCTRLANVNELTREFAVAHDFSPRASFLAHSLPEL
jgi:hypothetical protein